MAAAGGSAIGKDDGRLEALVKEVPLGFDKCGRRRLSFLMVHILFPKTNRLKSTCFPLEIYWNIRVYEYIIHTSTDTVLLNISGLP